MKSGEQNSNRTDTPPAGMPDGSNADGSFERPRLTVLGSFTELTKSRTVPTLQDNAVATARV